MIARLTVMAAAAVAVVAFGACATSAPSAPASAPPPVVVPGPATAYSGVTISSGTHRVSLTAAQWSGVAPLMAARSFVPPESLSAYGLAPPAAEIVFRRNAGPDITLEVGSAGFDAHFVYVMLPGHPSVYTVASTALRPLLAAVGVSVPEPTS